MRPSFKKSKIMDNWTDTLVKLDKIFCEDEDDLLKFLFFGFINFHKILSFDIVCIYVHKIYLYSNFEFFIDLIYTSSFFFLSHAKIF